MKPGNSGRHAGASRERIEPPRVALEHKLVNVLITNHVTADMLVSGV